MATLLHGDHGQDSLLYSLSIQLEYLTAADNTDWESVNVCIDIRITAASYRKRKLTA